MVIFFIRKNIYYYRFSDILKRKEVKISHEDINGYESERKKERKENAILVREVNADKKKKKQNRIFTRKRLFPPVDLFLSFFHLDIFTFVSFSAHKTFVFGRQRRKREEKLGNFFDSTRKTPRKISFSFTDILAKVLFETQNLNPTFFLTSFVQVRSFSFFFSHSISICSLFSEIVYSRFSSRSVCSRISIFFLNFRSVYRFETVRFLDNYLRICWFALLDFVFVI